jgi:hypothetical protein
MSGIDFNKSEEFIKNVSVFNDGLAGVVENVKVRIEKKASTDTDDKKPVYKVIATDSKGEVNEGYYYHKDASDKGFKNYQAQRLILLARGVLGDAVVFPAFNTPTEALDGIMANVAPALVGKAWRVVVTYGTTRRPESYLGFKNFGSFIQSMAVPNTLALDKNDNTIRKPLPAATPEKDLVAGMTQAGNPDNLDWMQTGK